MEIFGMGPLELGLIMALALIVFGPDKLPEIARQVGRTVGEIRRISSEVTSEFQRSIRDDASIGQRPPVTHQPPNPQPRIAPPASAPPTAEVSDGDTVRPPY
ncbi:MAG: putative twin-arginine translocation protein, TatA/E family [Chloroflexi bacterium]|nr:putative twin-arginine translocation protein, TatA/E family [Chloroflexota bacterium]